MNGIMNEDVCAWKDVIMSVTRRGRKSVREGYQDHDSINALCIICGAFQCFMYICIDIKSESEIKVKTLNIF